MFHVMLVVGIVYNALEITFVIAHFHLQLKLIFFHVVPIRTAKVRKKVDFNLSCL